MNSLFSTEGRLNRAKYFWRTLVISACSNMAAFLAVFLLGGMMGKNAEPAALIVGYLRFMAGGVMIAFGAVKRLHDLDRPGSHYWFMLTPFYNIYLGLLLLFKKGTSSPNQYGGDPLAAPQVGMNVARPAA
jgi:uncharacterized membrane protein YhaH (DUF805 family)